MYINEYITEEVVINQIAYEKKVYWFIVLVRKYG